MKEASEMSVDELRGELQRIREERSGKGRVRKQKAKTKRIGGQKKDANIKKNIEQEESAEWV